MVELSRGRPAEIIFGGSFDPIHSGHLLMASEICEALHSDRLLFIPAGQNPLKGESPGAIGAHRLEMVRRAIAGDARFSLSSRELDRPGPSRTFDTVEELITGGLVVEAPWLVVGEELLGELTQWYRIEELLSRVRLAIVQRGGENRSAPPLIPWKVQDVQWVRNARLEVSSREIRSRLREGREIRYLVPEAVYDYIHDNELYR